MSDPLTTLGTTPRTASMMNRIVASSLRQRFLVILMTLVLLAAGTRSLNRLPVDAYPDLSPPIVEIITQWPGHAAEEIERLITVPVEMGMNGIPQMITDRSISLYGLSDVLLTYQHDTDYNFARQESTGLLVPVSAILRDDENLPFVYVVQPDGSFARQHVTLGYRTADQYDIPEGVKAGDQIVDDGALFVQFLQNQ